MKKSHGLFLTFLTALTAVCFACQGNRNAYETSTGPAHISVDLNNIDADSVGLSTLTDSVSYLDLETTDMSLIGRIGDVKVTPQGIIVLDSKQDIALLFDRNGRFMRRIGSHGQGTEEYLHLVSIDADASTIYLNDVMNVIKYDYEGHCTGKDSIGSFDDIKHLANPDRYLCATFNSGEESGVYLVEPGEDYRKSRLLGRRDPVDRNLPWEFYSYGDETSIVSSAFEDDLYRFRGDSLVKVIDFDVTPAPSASDLEHWSRPDMQHHYVRTVLLDLPDKVITCYSRYPDLRYVIVDKADNSVTVTTKIYNDLTDGEFRFTRGVCDGKPVAYTSGADEDSNPRLMFLHLKNDRQPLP